MPRRSKRLKVSPNKNKSVAQHKVEDLVQHAVHEVEDNNSIGGVDMSDIWLPDGPCFLVYSFICNGSINASRYADGISSLVYNYSLISKDFHRSIQRYMQFAPMILRYRYKQNLNQRIQMICKKQVNLCEFHYDLVDENLMSTKNEHQHARQHQHAHQQAHQHDNDENNQEKVEDYVKILTSCKISNLHTLGLNLHGYRANNYHTFQNTKSIDFQKFIAREVAPSCKLTKIKICTHHNELHCPMLTRFSSSLKELEVIITRNHDDIDSVGLQKLTKVLKELKKLKKLKIANNNKFGSFDVNISSKSLEEIDLVGCDNDFFLDKVNCPSLRTIRCRYLHKEGSILPSTPSTRREVLNGIDPDDLPNFDEGLAKGIFRTPGKEKRDWLEVPAEIKGMTVSSNCKIAIFVGCGCCFEDS